MEPTPFELTPAQKGLLESLARETGKAIPSLLDEALEGLKAHMCPRPVKGEPHGSDKDNAAPQPHTTHMPIWEIAAELFGDIPDEELERLPPDGAAQHDHYIYGLPKRPT